MPQNLRRQLRNHFIVGLVPFGANIHDFIKPFLAEIHQLEHGFMITINNKRTANSKIKNKLAEKYYCIGLLQLNNL